MAKTQSLENHVRIAPLFHQVVLPILFIYLVWSIYRVIRVPSLAAAMQLLLAIGLILLAVCARIFANTVQDRVIRLEMRLRMERLLPPDLRARIPEFEVGQLIALRFAGDVELPELARRVLDEKLTDRKAIKQLIRDWQPDLLRA